MISSDSTCFRRKAVWIRCSVLLVFSAGICAGQGNVSQGDAGGRPAQPLLSATQSLTMPDPLVELRPAPRLVFPAAVDSNSPSFWDGNTFYLLNSASGWAMRS